MPFRDLPRHPRPPLSWMTWPSPNRSSNEWAADLPRHTCRMGESITMASKARMWIGFRAGVPGIALILMVTIAGAGTALAATSGTTHYIAANGSDSSNGTSNTAPGSAPPGCQTAAQAAPPPFTPQPGDQFIFRGGDTWHFGNSSAVPYVGGTWNWTWDGTSTNCDTSDNVNAVRTSCVYVGVDQSWYSGSTWCDRS